jgi:hypothetical protein
MKYGTKWCVPGCQLFFCLHEDSQTFKTFTESFTPSNTAPSFRWRQLYDLIKYWEKRKEKKDNFGRGFVQIFENLCFSFAFSYIIEILIYAFSFSFFINFFSSLVFSAHLEHL